ncbi:hypothetical protein HYW99_02660, partial [Candidatus Woesearchaeota archaeon]|nr:hypothetical protein [Candidatus Woesearchaeota archaeon]
MIGINAKSQTWSLDIILGVLVFVAAFFIFYIILGSSQPSNVKNLKEEASIVIKQVASDDNLLSVINNNEVNESKLHELKNLSYEELKRRLRITSDFCIYFEDD